MANNKQYLEVLNNGQDDLYIRDQEAHEEIAEIETNAAYVGLVVGDPLDDWDPGTAEEYFEQIQSEVENLAAIVNAEQLAIGAVQTDLVPTQGSANFCTSGAIYTALGKKLDTKDLPTKVSSFQNDVGYLTQHQDISGKADIDAVACLGDVVGIVD